MRLLLIDDHTLFADSLRFLLQEMDEMVESVAVRSVDEALTLSPDFDMVLLDLHLPDVSGFAGLHKLRSAMLGVPVVMLSGEENPEIIQAAIDSGAMGYVPKTSSPQVLMAAVQLILAGGVYLPLHVLQHMNGDAAGSKPLAVGGLSGLSKRQRQVLMKVVQGKPNKMIARELNIAESTVKSHLSTAYRVLDVTNRTEAVFRTANLGITL